MSKLDRSIYAASRVRRLVTRLVTSPRQRLHLLANGPRILANSFPKAGTNLLIRLLGLTGQVDFDRHIDPDDPYLENDLSSLWRGSAVSSHLYWSEDLVRRVLDPNGIHTLLIVRDLRDIAVSNYHYIVKTPHHRLCQYFRALPNNSERLAASIRGISSEDLGGQRPSHSIGTHARGYLGWLKYPRCLTVRFEDLVGAPGGGRDVAQRSAVVQILETLRLPVDDQAVGYICRNLFSDRAKNFRKGQIGCWQEEFSPDHVAMFEEVAGKELRAFGYEAR